MKMLIVFLLFIPLNSSAYPLSSDADKFVHEMQNLVKTERVVVRTGRKLETEDIGLLIHSKDMFSGSSELSAGGRLALEKASSFAKHSRKTLSIFVPDEREHKDFRPLAYSLHGLQVKRNAFIGPYVYIVITKNNKA